MKWQIYFYHVRDTHTDIPYIKGLSAQSVIHYHTIVYLFKQCANAFKLAARHQAKDFKQLSNRCSQVISTHTFDVCGDK